MRFCCLVFLLFYFLAPSTYMIADHDSGLLHPVNLRSVTLYTGWMASIFWLQSFVSQNGAGAPQCFFSLALKRPIKNTGFLL